MQRMEIHFIIDSQGNIQSVVKGAKGHGCKEIVEDIKKLGQTVCESPTGEFYEKEQPTIIRTFSQKGEGITR